jgi:hypothetical protein
LHESCLATKTKEISILKEVLYLNLFRHLEKDATLYDVANQTKRNLNYKNHCELITKSIPVNTASPSCIRQLNFLPHLMPTKKE